ncbi:MAG: hypothetical protein GY835_15195 [bacterium]|nr:hypothetical protein [bacterium]
MKKLLLVLFVLALAAPGALADFDRSVDGSTVIITPAVAEYDSTLEVCFEVWNGSDDFEYLVDLNFVFPECFTILDTYVATATPEAGIEFTGAPVFTGYNTNVANWHGGDTGFGFMIGLTTAFFCCTVQLDCDCDLTYDIGWTLTGDGYADDPHVVEGAVGFFVPPCSTPTNSSDWSTIKALY